MLGWGDGIKLYTEPNLPLPFTHPHQAAKDTWDADIYTLDWLFDCIQVARPSLRLAHTSQPFDPPFLPTQADKRLAPKHEHLIAATEATERRLLRSLDCYGDPLAEEGDVAELRKVCFAIVIMCA